MKVVEVVRVIGDIVLREETHRYCVGGVEIKDQVSVTTLISGKKGECFFSAETRELFAKGNALHDEVARVIKEYTSGVRSGTKYTDGALYIASHVLSSVEKGAVIEFEVPLACVFKGACGEEKYLFGTIDCVAKYGGKTRLFEFKSSKEVSASHVKQLVHYTYMMKINNPAVDLDDPVVLCVNDKRVISSDVYKAYEAQIISGFEKYYRDAEEIECVTPSPSNVVIEYPMEKIVENSLIALLKANLFEMPIVKKIIDEVVACKEDKFDLSSGVGVFSAMRYYEEKARGMRKMLGEMAQLPDEPCSVRMGDLYINKVLVNRTVYDKKLISEKLPEAVKMCSSLRTNYSLNSEIIEGGEDE